MVWEHVTPSDRDVVLPASAVLARISDPRAAQFWDAHRALSAAIVADLPADTLASVAQIESTGVKIAWDSAALFRAGARWDDRFPVPDWAGRPIVETADTLRVRLRALAPAPAAAPR